MSNLNKLFKNTLLCSFMQKKGYFYPENHCQYIEKKPNWIFLKHSKNPNKCVPGCVDNHLSYLAPLTGAHTIMVSWGLVTAHHTGLVDPGWRGRGGGHAYIGHCSRTLHLIHSLRVKHLTCKKRLKISSQSWCIIY